MLYSSASKNGPYGDMTIESCSLFAEEHMKQKLLETDLKAVDRQWSVLSGISLARGFAGSLFEQYCHSLFQRKGQKALRAELVHVSTMRCF